jgi:hypothetical protein
MKAIEKDRERRYATPSELAADPRAPRASPCWRRPRSIACAVARRNAVAVTTTALVLVSLLLGG